jgi:hypothetical protein
MPGKKKKEWLKSNIGQFVKEYCRKAQRGVEPNDRQYDRKVEKLIKRMDPKELSELLNEESPLESEDDVGDEKEKN